MDTRHDELRDELVAILGASRELSADADKQLAEAFIRFLHHQEEQGTGDVMPVEAHHQPHVSLLLAGGAWGAALMFLFLLLLLSNLTPVAFVVTSVVILSLLAMLTRVFLFMARHDWQVPRLRVTAGPASGKPHGRK